MSGLTVFLDDGGYIDRKEYVMCHEQTVVCKHTLCIWLKIGVYTFPSYALDVPTPTSGHFSHNTACNT